MLLEKFLDLLPTNFRHEKSLLIKQKLNDCRKLSQLSDVDIHNLQKGSLCTLNNLKKIRAIATFIEKLEISPPEAYVLLHCGVGSIKSLSRLNHYEVHARIGRLERSLRVKSATNITIYVLKGWIKRANEICKYI